MIPCFDVSHLPSSASFYSAVFQPLGIHYISPDTQTAAYVASYGTSSGSLSAPVFQIRETRSSPVSVPLKLSRALFSAPSPVAVTGFRSAALRANPALLLVPGPTTTTAQSGDGHRVAVTDLDGNTMEVVYQPPPSYPPSYAGSTVRTTQSTHEEVSRILDWNYDVAASESRSRSGPSTAEPSAVTFAMTSQASQFSGNEPYTILRRSVTTSFIETSPSLHADPAAAPAPSQAPAPSPPSSSSSLQTSTVVGSILGAAVGAAAGAALTYGMLRKERARAPLQEFDGTAPTPPFQRRATFPDQYPEHHGAGRYVEVERTVEKIRYPEHYPTFPENRVPSQYMAKHSQSQAGSRDGDDLYDDARSRHSPRYQLERASTVRPSSQVAVPRAAQLMLTDYEHQSNAGSRLSIAGNSAVPRTVVPEPESYETGTYVSARSVGTQSTVRPPPPTVETELAFRSKAPSVVPSRAPTKAPSKAPTIAPSQAPANAPSRAPTVAPSRAPTKAASQAPTYVPSKAPTKAPSRAPTVVRTPTIVRAPKANPVFAYPPATRAPTYMPAANRIPAPKSGIGSSHASWEDDAVSVAPSDSISCIGSRTGRRQYH
ncbi:cystathionine gamma-synthase protein [Colletotrichum musicola]|uniref:Cystathionine gamma-synthase protein n=1 Tax=Colletotrichum musicola TaxID=2175873 RepID=A0A8H6JKX2_9PEZI|nr:cystathionine gamma-synthase protein [Colletotrichum musicola]